MDEPAPSPRLATDAVMSEVRERVRAEMRARLVASGAAHDFADPQIFEDVDTLFRRALASDDPHALLLPHLLADDWRPERSLRLASHRGGATGAVLVWVKRRVLLPLTRWLFEYVLENFRRQDRMNLALMGCLQSLAAEQARLRVRVAELEAARAAPGAPRATAFER